MEYITQTPRQTFVLGRELALGLTPGTVLAFTGGLGAGKTAFIAGLAEGLGITQRVTSPTFTIVNEYLGGRLPLFHFDLYRVGGEEELFDLGWDDYLTRNGVCAVEWSENAPGAMGDGERLLRVSMTRTGDNSRRIVVEEVQV